MTSLFRPGPRPAHETVQAVLEEIQAWHGRAHISVASTFERCLQEPCANVQRVAQSRHHLRLVLDRSTGTTDSTDTSVRKGFSC